MRSHLRATLMGSGLLIACSALLLAAVTGALVLAAVVTVAGSLALGPAWHGHQLSASRLRRSSP